MRPEEAHELELRDYLRIVRRRKWIIVLSAVIVVGAASVASLLQTPVYQGRAELLLQPRTTESLFDPQTGQRNDPARSLQTEIRVLKSQPVKDAVRRELGRTPDVTVSPVGDTDVIAVKAESTRPGRAASTANAYARAYIDFRRKQAVDDLVAASQEIQGKVVDFQREIDGIDAQATSGAAQRRDNLVQQQALFKLKLDQLQVDAALKTGGAQLVTPAAVPQSPVKPTPLRNAVVALALGALLGVGLAFLSEHLDDSLNSKEDVERVTAEALTLALIPAVPSWKDRKEPMVMASRDPKSPAAEAYRTLRTSIQFIGLDRPMGTIQVTSPSASEGKSTTISNLGVALARAGLRVVIVDCDLRRPRVHEFFDCTNSIGFTSVLLGEVPLAAALQGVEGEERLKLLASGLVPPNPSELLSGRRTVEVLTAVQADADIVLVDCPPVLPVTDAAVLSSRVDATLLVATAGTTTRKELARAYEVLNQVSAPVIGVVLNGVTAEGAYGYGNSYYHYKAHDGDQRRRRQPPVKV